MVVSIAAPKAILDKPDEVARPAMGGLPFFVGKGKVMIAKISDIAEVQGGMILSRKEARNQEESRYVYKRLTLRAFDKIGGIEASHLEDFYACESLDNALFTSKGDVVVRLLSPMYPVYVENNYENILVPSQFAVLRVKDREVVMPEYLRLWLAQNSVQDRVLDLESGTAQKAVKIKTILNLEISIPPLEVQKKAVRIDTLSRRRECLYRELIEEERMLTENLLENIIGGINR